MHWDCESLAQRTIENWKMGLRFEKDSYEEYQIWTLRQWNLVKICAGELK